MGSKIGLSGVFIVLTEWHSMLHKKKVFTSNLNKKVCHWFVQGSVRALLHDKIRDAYTHPQFITDVMKPMQIESIIDQDVREEAWRGTRWLLSLETAAGD